MRLHNLLVFDDIISGSSGTWYSGSEFNRVLGSAETYAVQALTTSVSGFLPSLVVASEHSSDGQHWTLTGATELNGLIATDGFYFGTSGLALILGAQLRFRITLGGTTPKCRLKLYVTGRGDPGGSQRQALR